MRIDDRLLVAESQATGKGTSKPEPTLEKKLPCTSIRNRLPGTIERIVSGRVVLELVVRTANRVPQSVKPKQQPHLEILCSETRFSIETGLVERFAV